MIDRLNKITIGMGAGKWQNLRVALKSIWSSDRIEALAAKLSDYRQQLTLRILVLLNMHVGTLQKGSDQIVEAVSVNLRDVKAAFQNEYHALYDYLQEDRTTADKQHAEMMAALAILTSRSGKTRTITRPVNTEKPNLMSLVPGNSQTATTYRRLLLDADTDVEPPGFERSDFSRVTSQISDSLSFQAIDDRREVVALAHRETFQWIFRDPKAYDKRWHSFIDWLESGNGCYWISGKAGSGKSTLMKFILQDPRTEKALLKWAGQANLLVASFFFWNAGSELQKSQTGLIRSLLHQILSRRQELVPVLFPSLTRATLAGQVSWPIEVSSSELKAAFRTLVSHIPVGVKLFFLVDGLDEFDGDHNEISELLLQVAESPSIKIALSSRPTPACVHVFSHCPQLRLQDLTHDDIALYVQDRIVANPIMQRLQSREETASADLIEGILTKAAGVFLWVILVTKSLLNGLQNYDHLSDLMRRLDDLPSDLEKLYRHMLQSVEFDYRQQASRILQLVQRSTHIQGEFPITVLQLSYAEDDDYDRAMQAPITSITPQEEDWRCDATEGRLRSRCCGLVEIQDMKKFDVSDRSGFSLGFLHRTVVEFLQIPTIWDELVALTADTPFDVDRALSSSCLLEMKAKSQYSVRRRESRTHASLFRLANYAAKMDLFTKSTHTLFWNQVVDTIMQQRPEGQARKPLHRYSEVDVISAAAAQACDNLKPTYPNSLLFLLVSRGLTPVSFDVHQHCFAQKIRSIDQLPAYLLIQSFEQSPTSMLGALALGMKHCAPEADPKSSLLHCAMDADRHSDILHRAMESRSRRWIDVLEPSSHNKWSLWTFALYHAYVLFRSSAEDLKAFIDCAAMEMLFSNLETLSRAKQYRGKWQRCCFLVCETNVATRQREQYRVDEIAVIQLLTHRVLEHFRTEEENCSNATNKPLLGRKDLCHRLVTMSDCILLNMMTPKEGYEPDYQAQYLSVPISGSISAASAVAITQDVQVPLKRRFHPVSLQAFIMTLVALIALFLVQHSVYELLPAEIHGYNLKH